MAVFVLSFLSPKTATPSHERRFEGDAGEEGLLLGHGAAMRLVARQLLPQNRNWIAAWSSRRRQPRDGSIMQS